MSLPETLLWQRLRRDSTGARIRHQHPIGPYQADFYCAKAKLVIEVDGEHHNRGDRPAHDIVRDQYMMERGYRVLRVAAAEILRDPDAIAQSIASLVANPLHHSATPSVPPPRERGGAER